jgi:uncharacterized membrane protein SpoIIM required for sporulation
MANKKRKVINKPEMKGKKGFRNLVCENFRISLNYLKKTKGYIWISFFAFLLLALIGYFLPVFYTKEIIAILKELVSKTEGLDLFGLIRFIFLNNIKSSLAAIIFGIALGIIPVLVIMINGYVLGFVASMVVAEEGIGVLWRLLPHGVFELPAVFISIGLGLKLGLFWAYSKEKFRSFLALFSFTAFFLFSSSVLISLISFFYSITNNISFGDIDTVKILMANPLISFLLLLLFALSIKIALLIFSNQDRKDFGNCLLDSIRVFVFIVIPLLIIAAIIEGTLIYLLG